MSSRVLPVAAGLSAIAVLAVGIYGARPIPADEARLRPSARHEDSSDSITPAEPVASRDPGSIMPITVDGVSIGAPMVFGTSRLIAKTVTMTIEMPALRDARGQLDGIMRLRGGAVIGVIAAGAQAMPPPDAGGRAFTATLRVPASQGDKTLTDLRALGIVRQESASTEDLTARDQMLTSGIIAAHADDQRLTTLLTRPAALRDPDGIREAQRRAKEDLARERVEQSTIRDKSATLTVVLTIRVSAAGRGTTGTTGTTGTSGAR